MDIDEFDKRVDASKPEHMTNVDWRTSSARVEVALNLWLKDAAVIYGKQLERLYPALSPSEEKT